MQVLRSLKFGLWLVRTFPAPVLSPLAYPLGFATYADSGWRRARPAES